MKFQSQLKQAPLIKRYKRFLVDIKTHEGITTIHCANTGRMTGCADEGFTAFYSTSCNKKRKYAHSLELTKNNNGDMICVNTSLANHIVAEAINNKQFSELTEYQDLKQEVKYGKENSRIDILLSAQDQPDCYIEVKSVTLLEQNGQGFFPDAKTERGIKHIRELQEMKRAGHRAILFFLVQHSGIKQMAPAAHIDPQYAAQLKEAINEGVEVLCYNTHITENEILLNSAIEFRSEPVTEQKLK